jgi:hypothetical protein
MYSSETNSAPDGMTIMSGSARAETMTPALEDGPQLPFTAAISPAANCRDQAEAGDDWR